MSCNRFLSCLILLVFFTAFHFSFRTDNVAAAGTRRTAQNAPQSEKAEASESHSGDTRNQANNENDSPIGKSELHNPVLWHDPGAIASLDLFYGEGGKAGQPEGPFTFESEDETGSNPKFEVSDKDGTKWKVKLGDEARPEVVASRLLWATGYFVNDDYLMESAEVKGLHLNRGQEHVKEELVKDARFARKPTGQKKIGIWNWKENPFTGTREFNGLRVMMAVMNNWDLKDVNNAVFLDAKTGREMFLASDIGATFGTNGLSWTKARSKGNIGSFKNSRFILHASDTDLDFATPRPPTAVLVETAGFSAKEYANRSGLNWIGNNIPRADARWIGSLLKQLTHHQLVDAFRAGNFPPDQIDAYVEVVESRIQELSQL